MNIANDCGPDDRWPSFFDMDEAELLSAEHCRPRKPRLGEIDTSGMSSAEYSCTFEDDQPDELIIRAVNPAEGNGGWRLAWRHWRAGPEWTGIARIREDVAIILAKLGFAYFQHSYRTIRSINRLDNIQPKREQREELAELILAKFTRGKFNSRQTTMPRRT